MAFCLVWIKIQIEYLFKKYSAWKSMRSPYFTNTPGDQGGTRESAGVSLSIF